MNATYRQAIVNHRKKYPNHGPVHITQELSSEYPQARPSHIRRVLLQENLIEKNSSTAGEDYLKQGQAVRQESWQEIESESLLLGKAVTTRRVPES